MDTPTPPPPPPLSVEPIGVFPVDKTTTLPQNIVRDRVRGDCTSGVISSTATTNLQTTTTTTEKMGGEKSTKESLRSPSSSSSFLYLQTVSPTKKQSFQRPIPSVAKAKMKKNSAPLGNEMVHNTSPPPPPPPCTECGKTFRTLKSLFGHMRSHPERSWRGIKPPANCQRPPSLPSPPVLNFDFNQTEQEVASALILLGRSPPRFAVDRAHGRRRTRRRRENNRTSSHVPPPPPPPSKSTGIQVPVLEIDLNQPPLPGHSNDGIDSDTSLDLKLSL